MNIKMIIILIVVIVLAVGGFFAYQNISSHKTGEEIPAIEEKTGAPEEEVGEQAEEQAEKQTEEETVSLGEGKEAALEEKEEESTSTPIQITSLDNTIDPDWSPDGSQVVFCIMEGKTKTLYLVNTNGSGLKEIGPGFDPSWNPVEDKIAYELNQQIYTMNSKGEGITQLTTESINGQSTWSPDGTKIAYAHYEAEKASIWIMNADGSGKTQLTTSVDGKCTFPSFSYDGSKIVYIKGYIWNPLTEKLPKLPNEIWVMNADGSNRHQLYAPVDDYLWIFQRAWNKNNEILFAISPLQEMKIPEIGVINSDGSNLRYILAPLKNFLGIPECFYLDPVWDNTGNKIAAVKKVIEGTQNIITFYWGK